MSEQRLEHFLWMYAEELLAERRPETLRFNVIESLPVSAMTDLDALLRDLDGWRPTQLHLQDLKARLKSALEDAKTFHVERQNIDYSPDEL